MTKSLLEIADSAANAVEFRMVKEYGAVFLTKGTAPPVIVFRDAAQVEEFQHSLVTATHRFGGQEIELQAAAMQALKNAADELRFQGYNLSARAADSGRRSFEQTEQLWTRNVTRGLDHWESIGLLESARADVIRAMPALDQVPLILELEERERLYFSTFFDKSILYSVAAPGASQHLSMLAFDVAEFQESEVENALHRNGWFRTVIEDFPHFTYLGYTEDELPKLGLKTVRRDFQAASCTFWIPEL